MSLELEVIYCIPNEDRKPILLYTDSNVERRGILDWICYKVNGTYVATRSYFESNDMTTLIGICAIII